MKIFTFFLGMTFIFLLGCGKRNELTVSAAVSLRDPLKIIGDHFRETFPGIRLTFNFGASGSLSRQIDNGAPVDLFISAAEIHMRNLIQTGLINPQTEKFLLTNSLVLISPADGKRFSNLNDLTSPSVRKIAIGEFRSAGDVEVRNGCTQASGAPFCYRERLRRDNRNTAESQ